MELQNFTVDGYACRLAIGGLQARLREDRDLELDALRCEADRLRRAFRKQQAKENPHYVTA